MADAIGSRDLREARRREIQAALRDPAVAYLKQAVGTDVAAPEYVLGLIAFFERRFPEALAHADAARARVPSLYEASLLRADVHTLRSREQQETGDEAGSAGSVDEAESAFRAVAEYARSEPGRPRGAVPDGAAADGGRGVEARRPPPSTRVRAQDLRGGAPGRP